MPLRSLRIALSGATYRNHGEAARALIAAGGDVNAVDTLDISAYLMAGARRYLEIMKHTAGAR